MLAFSFHLFCATNELNLNLYFCRIGLLLYSQMPGAGKGKNNFLYQENYYLCALNQEKLLSVHLGFGRDIIQLVNTKKVSNG